MQRRDWLKAALLGVCGASIGTHGQWLAANTAGRRLVLVELTGANDGLNTLVPVRNDHYHKLRPTLALSNKQVIDLQDDHALHHRLKPLVNIRISNPLSFGKVAVMETLKVVRVGSRTISNTLTVGKCLTLTVLVW